MSITHCVYTVHYFKLQFLSSPMFLFSQIFQGLIAQSLSLIVILLLVLMVVPVATLQTIPITPAPARHITLGGTARIRLILVMTLIAVMAEHVSPPL